MCFCKWRHLLNLRMKKGDVFFMQILGKVSAKDKVGVINQVEHVDCFCQVCQKQVPAVQGR